MKLLSDKISTALTGLYGLFFVGNSICDNVTTQLEVDFLMPNTSNIVHYQIAHKLPLIADKVAEYASSRGVSLKRPSVEENMKEYHGIRECFSDILDYCLSVEKEMCSVIEFSCNNEDKITAFVLQDILKDFLSLTKLSMDLSDYSEAIEENSKSYLSMDNKINKFLRIKYQE